MTGVPTSMPDGMKLCGVCGLPLDWSQDRGHHHARRDDQDHVVVPVAPGAVSPTLRCDVCDRPATHEVDARPFLMFPGQRSVGGWALDGPCAELLAAGNLGGMVDRWAEAKPQHDDPDVRLLLLDLYERLLAHVTGAPRPLPDR